jgi:NAD(P)-dependent dehydrogenase (short-subunit alcohol dehydrogenase family)
VITGATGGVGARLVNRFLREGWRVFAAARRAGAIGCDGVVGVQLDLESSDSMAAATETIIGQLGPHGLDALINCAGVIVDGPVELIPDDELRRSFAVNVIGPISLTRRLLPSLRTARGRIVNIGAISAQTTPPFFGEAREMPSPWLHNFLFATFSQRFINQTQSIRKLLIDLQSDLF